MKKGSRALKFSLAVLVFLAAWIFLAPFSANHLIVEKPIERADAILVLGGSSVYLERTMKAAEEYKKFSAPKILLTDDGEKAGWSQTEKRNPPFVELAQKNLILNGVPFEAIEIIKPSGSGTIYEAQILLQKVRENNWQTILLVTSAYHTRRTLRTFEKVFAHENISFGIAAAPPGQQTPNPAFWWLSPNGWSFVAGEYVKSFYYWVYY